MAKIDLPQIIELAKKHHPEEMARILQINVGTLKYHLKKHNITTPNGRTNLTDDLKRQIIELSINGKYGTQIAKELNLPQQTVRYFLFSNKIQVLNGIKAPRISEEKNKEIIELAELGLCKTKIQNITGVSKAYIAKFCEEQNIELIKGTYRKYTYEQAERLLNPIMQLTGAESKGFYEVQCKKHLDFIKSRPIADFHQGCPRCSNCGNSKGQEEVYNFFIENKIKAINKYKPNEGSLREIDIYLPDYKIGIEYCGLYWHSDRAKEPKPNNYHYDKMIMANKNGIRLITIFEDEWALRRSQILNFIKSTINISEVKIHARECVIKIINNKESYDFMDLYHIQGKPRATKIAFGLYNNNELIGVMSGGEHHRQTKNKGCLILDRLCFKDGVNVRGGASKLFQQLKTWAKENNYNEIKSWSDNRWSEGKVYTYLGFNLQKECRYDYSYIKNRKRFGKQSKKKAKLIKEGGVGNTESELALSLGYSRIYDCGKKRWVFTL